MPPASQAAPPAARCAGSPFEAAGRQAGSAAPDRTGSHRGQTCAAGKGMRMPGDCSSSDRPVPIAWATHVEGEPPRTGKLHLWDEVPWEVARHWPAKRLRTLCGMVVPQPAVPGAPADASVPAVRAQAPAETTELGLCERCQRALAVRRAGAAGPGANANPEGSPGPTSG